MANDIIQFLRGTASEWAASSYVLEEGEIGIEIDTKKMKIGTGANLWTGIEYTTKEIEDEITRVKTDIGTSILPVFAWRGNGVPTLPTDIQRAYYIHSIVLKDSAQAIDIPANAPEDCIFSVENNDRTDYLTIRPPSGETINGTNSYKANYDTLSYFVKTGVDWVLAYGGVFPNNYDSMKSTIQSLLTTQLHTIDEITAQLKDRLHTFREIQTEFKDQLHTFDALEANGFARATYRYGVLPDQTVPHDDNSWIKGEFPLNEEKVIPFVNEGSKYLAFLIPSFMTPLIKELQINSTPMGFEDHDYLYNELAYTILIADTQVQTGANIRVKFEFGEAGGSGGSTGIEIDDGTSDAASIDKINIKGAKITELPNQGSMGVNEIEVTAGLNIHMKAPDQQYGLALCNELIVEPPLQVDDTPTGEFTGKLYIKHDAFEAMHAPSYLAYIGDEVEIAGKKNRGEKGHNDGKLWFGDKAYPEGPYIELDVPNKEIGLQEADTLDPNISGGTDYIAGYQVKFRGTAPNDGFIKAYLYDKNIDPFEPTGYKRDKNGHAMVYERFYKGGAKINESLDLVGMINAKGLSEFSFHVVNDFTNDTLVIADKTEGPSVVVIQAITTEEKIGTALQQFELDTGKSIEFGYHYLGPDRMSLGFINSVVDPVVSYTAGTNLTFSDGYELINRSGLKNGVVANRQVVQDDGIHMVDFNFGRVFSAEETQMLRGKVITVTTISTTKNGAFDVYMFKWTGKPDEYTKNIIDSWNNLTPVLETSWDSAGSFEVVENILTEDNTTTHDFTVPSDANNYAIMVVPSGGPVQPYHIELKELKVDVKEPFTGYVLHAPVLDGEKHLELSTEYKKFTQGVQGYASLRYTLNDVAAGMPMPCGIPGIGAADITLDTTVNQVSGSSARGGEGALKFTNDGTLTLNTDILLWNEQDTENTATFWWSKVSTDGNTFTKIPGSEESFKVPANQTTHGIKYSMPELKDIEILAGDRIALRGKADKKDGAFIECVSDARPMVVTHVKFVELIADSGDDPFADLDLSGFDQIFTWSQSVRKDFANTDTVTMSIDIPSNMVVQITSVVVKSGGKVSQIQHGDLTYENGILTAHLGKPYSEGFIILEFKA